jgi:hypothetical protein
MFTTLAKVRIADAQRFIDVFSTHGLAKRRAHGSQGAQVRISAIVAGCFRLIVAGVSS